MRYGSRKFLLALATLAATTWALAEKLIGAGDWKAVVLGTAGLYIAGNVGQRAIENRAQEAPK